MKSKKKVYPNPGCRLDRGYTLIELMIVVTLIGVVSSIAYSSFTGYTRLADRSDVQADLYEISQIMERGYTDSQDYTLVEFDGSAVGTSATDLDFFNDRNDRYSFSVTAVAPAGGSASTYTVEALPTSESRDNFDFQLNERGTERFRPHGGTSWTTSNVGIGWDNID